EYNRWYNEQHLGDVLKVPGFTSAQRFSLMHADADSVWRYLALYEFESDDANATLAALTQRAGTAEMPLSDAMDLSAYSVTPWTAITPRRSADT
ncbi:MAG: hypothetical protein VX836_11955, partial [Pseudomonadota bacterium]|nr:hypothetical protein [Pseudomonadota bacterium]